MHWFIVPNLDGPITGGTLYNRMLLQALRRKRIRWRALAVERSAAALAGAAPGDWLWLDSLYLGHAPRFAAAVRSGARLGLILHALPSLLDGSRPDQTSRWPPAERAALRAAQACLVTSPFMLGVVRRLVRGGCPVLHVPPGRLARRPAALPAPPVRAVMVANLLPGKRVEELLGALRDQLRDSDRFHLRVVGGARLHPEYAQRCRRMADLPPLRGRVQLAGEASPARTLREMAAGNLMLSASRMESYGMALAEARTLGLPILATSGGHVERLVDPEAGGELVGEPSQLAEACLALARDPDEHRRRLAAARARAWPARPWSRAAEDWLRETRGIRAGNRPQPRGAAVEAGVHAG